MNSSSHCFAFKKSKTQNITVLSYSPLAFFSLSSLPTMEATSMFVGLLGNLISTARQIEVPFICSLKALNAAVPAAKKGDARDFRDLQEWPNQKNRMHRPCMSSEWHAVSLSLITSGCLSKFEDPVYFGGALPSLLIAQIIIFAFRWWRHHVHPTVVRPFSQICRLYYIFPGPCALISQIRLPSWQSNLVENEDSQRRIMTIVIIVMSSIDRMCNLQFISWTR